MPTDILRYSADGLSFESQFFAPKMPGKAAGILVFPEVFGLGPHAIERAERLAEMGYAALACDIHGDAACHESLEESLALLKPLFSDRERMRERARSAYHALAARPEVDPARLAAIGFCFGGTMALELARGGADLKAVAGFHCALTTSNPMDAERITAKVLMMIGADDPGIGPDQRAGFEQEMRAAGLDWQLHVYGGVVHSFTNRNMVGDKASDRARYSPEADARSWTSMQALFAETIDGTAA